MSTTGAAQRQVLVTTRLAEANEIVKLLVGHGIEASIAPVGHSMEPPVDAAAVSVGIEQLDAAIALLTDVRSAQAEPRIESTGLSGKLLIPVDFSSYSDLACRVGFEFARRLGLRPVVLHVFVAPLFVPGMGLAGDADTAESGVAEEIGDMLASRRLRAAALERLRNFKARLAARCRSGELPDLPFDAQLEEGTPEQVILEWTRRNAPELVVMATRGHTKKKEQQIGSVAAEVLDSCRVPVFTVPENYSFLGVSEIQRLVFFCNLDHQDVESMESFMRLFDFPSVELTLVPVADRPEADAQARVEKLCAYFRQAYPTVRFSTAVFGRASFSAEASQFFAAHDTQLLVVPNKKTNIFRRLFNPGLAHRMLFEQDAPMFALPV